VRVRGAAGTKLDTGYGSRRESVREREEMDIPRMVDHEAVRSRFTVSEVSCRQQIIQNVRYGCTLSDPPIEI
jgi:hypothetical protein